MIVQGIELTEQEWDNLLPQVDEILKQSTEFIELLQPLNIEWKELEIMINEE